MFSWGEIEWGHGPLELWTWVAWPSFTAIPNTVYSHTNLNRLKDLTCLLGQNCQMFGYLLGFYNIFNIDVNGQWSINNTEPGAIGPYTFILCTTPLTRNRNYVNIYLLMT